MKQTDYILIDGLTLMKLEECLTSLLEFYGHDTGIGSIDIYNTGQSDNQYIVTFPVKPGLERFRYFVNFLTYPVIEEGLSSPPKVIGYSTVQEREQQSKQMSSKRWMIYVPEKDTEFDMVYGIYAGAPSTIKFPFDLPERTEELSFKQFDFAEPQINFNELELTGTVHTPEGIKQVKKGCAGILGISLTILISLIIVLS